MPVALKQFIKQIEDSGVIAAGKLENFIPPKASPKDAQELARQLVESKQLTKFQAQEIWQGRAKSLILGNYTILDRIGAGGMGQVFKAEHRRMDRIVAIKMLPQTVVKDAAAVARFEREVKAAAKLRHPHIVATDDADEANGVHFLVMEYIEGSDLSALVKAGGPLPVAKAAGYILQAARGLEFAHKRGVIHRDIKPANLLVDAEGTVKILDMGLARIEAGGDTATQAELTGTGAVMGTVDYMAPEQALSTKHADARADIYSLGCTLYYLLTGSPLYDGETLTAKLIAHQSHPVPELRAICADVPAELEAVFQKMVVKKVEDRYQTMGEVVRALETSSFGQPSPSSDQQSISANADKDALTSLRDVAAISAAKPKLVQQSAAAKIGEGKRKLIRGAIGAGLLVLTIFAGVIFKLKARDGTETAKVDQPAAETGAPEPAVAPFDAAQAKRHQEAWAAYLKVPVELKNSIGMKLVLIPPGEYQMGTSDRELPKLLEMAEGQFEGWEPAAMASEVPQHLVRITRPFFLGAYEVTNGEFQQFPAADSAADSKPRVESPDAEMPAGGATNEQMADFCKWLSEREQSKYRLPTEAEWEYACRAGTTTPFAFGDSLSSTQANFNGDFPFGGAEKGPNRNMTTKVGSFAPNAWGLYDMHGNVWEVCCDGYAADAYQHHEVNDPIGLPTGATHVLRGGDFEQSRGFAVRSATRLPYAPPYFSIGLRVVREIP